MYNTVEVLKKITAYLLHNESTSEYK